MISISFTWQKGAFSCYFHFQFKKINQVSPGCSSFDLMFYFAQVKETELKELMIFTAYYRYFPEYIAQTTFILDTLHRCTEVLPFGCLQNKEHIQYYVSKLRGKPPRK